jgi:hypothetical protein
VRTARNIAIIAVLAFFVAAAPGGGETARGALAALTICFLAVIGFAGFQIYRQNQLTYVSLDTTRRAVLIGAAGAIVLMIAGADELTESGLGLFVWLAVLGVSIFAIVRVWTDAHTY